MVFDATKANIESKEGIPLRIIVNNEDCTIKIHTQLFIANMCAIVINKFTIWEKIRYWKLRRKAVKELDKLTGKR